MNFSDKRQQLWDALLSLSQQIHGAWCILGDFNSVLYKEDKTRGYEIADAEVQELRTFLDVCELQEMAWTGTYYSWTNKTIWSRIDRVFINTCSPEVFNDTIAKYFSSGLSDHTPVLIQFPDSPLPKSQFQFC